MKPIFTIHAGEYLVGEYLEQRYGAKKGWRIWTPSKDTGIDLLVTSADCRKTFSIQVKFSKSFPQSFECVASGWWLLKYNAIQNSKADCWVFVLPAWPRNTDEKNATKALNVDDCSFVVIEPKELLRRLNEIHPNVKKGGEYNVYLTKIGKDVLETREIGRGVEENITKVQKDKDQPRNFTVFADNWKALEKALK